MQRTLVQPFKSSFVEVNKIYCKHFSFLIFRKEWSLLEDTQLLLEFQKTPKKWAKISRKLVKRNEHQAKNRFICLMAKELFCSREEIRILIKTNSILREISMILLALTAKNIKENEKNEQKEKNNSQKYESEFDFAKFLNF